MERGKILIQCKYSGTQQTLIITLVPFESAQQWKTSHNSQLATPTIKISQFQQPVAAVKPKICLQFLPRSGQSTDLSSIWSFLSSTVVLYHKLAVIGGASSTTNPWARIPCYSRQNHWSNDIRFRGVPLYPANTQLSLISMAGRISGLCS